MPPTWEPLLEGAQAAAARQIVDDIAGAVEALPASDEPGLKGDASSALLLSYCGSPSAATKLGAALRPDLAATSTISLFGGLTGTSWVLQQLAEGDEVDTVVTRYDTALLRYLEVSRWEEEIDLMSGLAGVGAYVSARTDALAMAIAAQVLTHLENLAVRDTAGITWPTGARPQRGEADPSAAAWTVDLGVAHGVVGVIGMLAQFVEMKVHEQRSRALLQEALRWLLTRAPSTTTPGARFKTSWPSAPGDLARLGWCYGDAGVAGVLLAVARVEALEQVRWTAVQMLENLARSQVAVVDACWCHGAAGLAHIYNVAYQRTGDAGMKRAARRWLAEILRLRKPGSGFAGYETIMLREALADPGLVTGAAGIALVLLAAMSDEEPAWQRLFLL